MASTSSSSKYHLKELLSEDQEPFVLNNYIHEKRSSSRRRSSSHVCNNVCFVSLQHTPPTKSPLFDFSKTTNRTDTIFVHIPAKTAAMLLEAAMKIQNQTEQNPKPKSSKNIGFSLFGSILKRLKRRKKSGVERDCDIKVSVKDILSWDSGEEEKKGVSDVGVSCSGNSSATWTEMETSTSKSEDSQDYAEEEEEEETESKILNFDVCEKGSPFRFVISPLRRSPELLSPSTSPNRRKTQVAKNDEGHLQSGDQEQKEEKEHYCSPVSVLDLEIDDDEGQDENELEDEDDSELERSFAFVHKAKQKLLRKLRRFELLAELDPLELEKRMAEDEEECEDEEGEEYDDEKDEHFDEDIVLQNNEKRKGFDEGVFWGSNSSNRRKAPLDMKRLLIDLMNEEGAVADFSGRALAGNKRCRRLDSLKDLERNAVNMMVETDFRGERNEWQKNSVHVEETVVEVEFAIFELLVEELSLELSSV